MPPMPWFRVESALVDDERIRLLAFEDRWHLVAITCCKGLGLFDRGSDPALLQRQLAVKLGLQLRELEAALVRLAEVGLIDESTYEPVDWARQQHGTNGSSTERVQRHRAAKRAATLQRVTRNVTAVTHETDVTPHTTLHDTTAGSSSSSSDLVLPPQLNAAAQAELSSMLSCLDGVVGQKVADELTGKLELPSSRHPDSPLDWTATLIDRARQGEFRPRLGIAVAARRKRDQEAAQADADRRAAEAARNTPEARQRADAAAAKARADIAAMRAKGVA